MATVGMKAVMLVIAAAFALCVLSLAQPRQGMQLIQPAMAEGCSEAPGFICYSLSYSAATGNIMTQIVQDTPSNWTGVSVEFMPEGTYYPNDIPQASWNGSVALSGTIVHGIPYNLTVPATGPVALGAGVSGQIWARFRVSANSTVYYTRLETVNAIAT